MIRIRPCQLEVIGKVHQQTLPALRLLEQEGFRYNGYVDIFVGNKSIL